jgi:serine/threonine-protein kinase
VDELRERDRNIWIQEVAAAGNREPCLQSPANERMARFSPDGRWVAYVSDASGRDEVRVRSFSDPNGLWQVTTEGGTQPVWARSGRELFYRKGDAILSVEVASSQVFTAGRPRVLFSGPFVRRDAVADYDVFPDGQHFVMVAESNFAVPAELHVITEWFEELKRLRPAAPE